MKPNFANFSAVAPLYFQPAKGQVHAELAGELAILDSKSGIYYGLDPVGARIWSLLLGWKNVAEVRAILLEEYDVAPAQLEADILHLFDELHGKGLIEVASADSKPLEPMEESVPELR